jgi:hypothetical protein
MIIREFYETRKDGIKLYRTYSNADVHIKKVGTEEVYTEAIDVEDAPFVYEETDIRIETEEPVEDELTEGG